MFAVRPQHLSKSHHADVTCLSAADDESREMSTDDTCTDEMGMREMFQAYSSLKHHCMMIMWSARLNHYEHVV